MGALLPRPWFRAGTVVADLKDTGKEVGIGGCG